MRITAAGCDIVARAREMLGSWNAMRASASALKSGDQGEVRIGAVGSAFFEALPTLLSVARAELPDLRLIVEEMETPALVDALRVGELHFAFVRPPVRAGLVTRTVWSEPFALAVSDSDPLATSSSVAVGQLADRSFIFFPRDAGPGYWDQVSGLFADADAEFAPEVTAAHVTTILGQVALGAGVSIVPTSASRVHIPGVAYLPLTSIRMLSLAVAYRPIALPPGASRVLETLPKSPIRL